MDKELENILKKANKGNKSEGERSPVQKTFPPNEPYDHLVFTKLVAFTGFNKLVFLFMIPTAMCIGFFFKDLRFDTILGLLIYAGIILIYSIINFFRFRA